MNIYKIIMLSSVVIVLHAKQDTKKTVAPIVETEKVFKDNTKQKNKVALQPIDAIALVIYTDKEPLVLTQSECERPSINGQKQSKEEIILQRIMEYEAVHVYTIPVSDAAVDNYITTLKEQYHIDEKQLEAMFKNAGYSYKEGVAELKRMLLIDALLNFKIKSRLIVTEQDIRNYYDKNVQKEPTSYHIKKGFLSFSALSEDERAALQKTGAHSEAVEWIDPYWLEEDEIAEGRSFIKTLQPQQIVLEPVSGGYEVVMFIEKKAGKKRSFEASYKEIAEKLKQPLFEKMLDEYKKELLTKYSVVDL